MLKCYLCSRHPLRQTAARRPARTVFAANSDNMQINKAEFKCSSERISQVPKDALKDIAFIGRSNVGKSSLINMLTGRKGLAKTSQTPGKTLLINHFSINDGKFYIVDLPGYGYAARGKDQRAKLRELIENYVLHRREMTLLFVLLDVRHAPQKVDMEFMTFLGENQVPFAIIFTKADKLGPVAVQRNVDAYRRALSEHWEELPPVFVTSSSTGTGRDQVLDYIESVNRTVLAQQKAQK